MNRYTAQGLTSEAADGRVVVVVSARHTETRQALDEVARSIPRRSGLRATVRYASGTERVEFASGGAVLFTTLRSLDRFLRGLPTGLLVYVDTASRLTMREVEALTYVRAIGGEVVHP